ncbi:hypothetical protein RND71_039518 [Anisodus tanguticus]|uniref:Uncharacterized protein n=1 Tax=Anisodus tanguticus TaxID=243964 RepID=A0AAE1US29_9SOLA|nr:hypothetical protein RND71_039518 [Anisodus tanguticus]
MENHNASIWRARQVGKVGIRTGPLSRLHFGSLNLNELKRIKLNNIELALISARTKRPINLGKEFLFSQSVYNSHDYMLHKEVQSYSRR